MISSVSYFNSFISKKTVQQQQLNLPKTKSGTLLFFLAHNKMLTSTIRFSKMYTFILINTLIGFLSFHDQINHFWEKIKLRPPVKCKEFQRKRCFIAANIRTILFWKSKYWNDRHLWARIRVAAKYRNKKYCVALQVLVNGINRARFASVQSFSSAHVNYWKIFELEKLMLFGFKFKSKGFFLK